MAAGTITWNGQTFNRAVRLQGRQMITKAVTFDYPNIDGVEKVDMGLRGRVMPYLAELHAADFAALDAAIAVVEALVQYQAATMVEAGSYANTELTSFEVLSRHRTHDNKAAAICRLVFTQLRF
jgi:hypothetical protein